MANFAVLAGTAVADSRTVGTAAAESKSADTEAAGPAPAGTGTVGLGPGHGHGPASAGDASAGTGTAGTSRLGPGSATAGGSGTAHVSGAELPVDMTGAGFVGDLADSTSVDNTAGSRSVHVIAAHVGHGEVTCDNHGYERTDPSRVY